MAFPPPSISLSLSLSLSLSFFLLHFNSGLNWSGISRFVADESDFFSLDLITMMNAIAAIFNLSSARFDWAGNVFHTAASVE